jgi:hypothetical protein
MIMVTAIATGHGVIALIHSSCSGHICVRIAISVQMFIRPSSARLLRVRSWHVGMAGHIWRPLRPYVVGPTTGIYVYCMLCISPHDGRCFSNGSLAGLGRHGCQAPARLVCAPLLVWHCHRAHLFWCWCLLCTVNGCYIVHGSNHQYFILSGSR